MSSKLKEFEKKCRDFLQNYVPWNKERLFVSGGVFPRLYHDLPMADIDIFANDDEAFQIALVEFKDAGFYTKHGPTRQKFCKLVAPDGQRVELISFHDPRGTAWCHTFDFAHCMSWMNENDFARSHVLDQKSILINRIMKFYRIGSKNVLSRLKKYLDLGYTIEESELQWLYDRLITLDYKSLPVSIYGGER